MGFLFKRLLTIIHFRTTHELYDIPYAEFEPVFGFGDEHDYICNRVFCTAVYVEALMQLYDQSTTHEGSRTPTTVFLTPLISLTSLGLLVPVHELRSKPFHRSWPTV